MLIYSAWSSVYRNWLKKVKNWSVYFLQVWKWYVSNSRSLCRWYTNILSNDHKEKENLKELKKRFKRKEISEAHHILDMQIMRDHKKGIITLDQSSYIKQMLSKFNM